MAYYIDIEKISIDDYCKKLASAYLSPGRLILKENLDERFGYFKSIGIENVKGLGQLLKKKDKFSELSNIECLSAEYLTILLREINSIHPKPNNLSDFVKIAKDTVFKLQEIGITNTQKLYELVYTSADRQKVADNAGVTDQEILQLAKLADLSRIRWVGATYAQLLFDIGADTVEKVSKSSAVDLHVRINQIIKEQNIFKGAIGLNDVKILVEAAKELPFDIEF